MKRINLLALQTTIKDSDFQRRSKTLLLKRLRFVRIKIILKNTLFFRNVNFLKGRMFLYIWLYFKKCFEKYFLVFDGIFENIIKNIFSTCCSHFFGCQTNIYHSFLNTEIQIKSRKKSSTSVAFSHIFSIAKQIYNIIHSSIQKHKQNLEKKKSNPVILREEGREREATRFDEGLRSAQRRDRDQRGARLWVILSLFFSPFARLWAPLFARLSSRSDLKVK